MRLGRPGAQSPRRANRRAEVLPVDEHRAEQVAALAHPVGERVAADILVHVHEDVPRALRSSVTLIMLLESWPATTGTVHPSQSEFRAG